MFIYDKKLQYPVKIDHPNPRLASIIISQYGGPDGELGASNRYLSQRYAMPYDEVKALLTDIGTEEMAHAEIICAMLYQLTHGASAEELKRAGMDAYYTDHTNGIWPQSAGGLPFDALTFQSKGDPITDLVEDMAADAAIS